MSLELREYDMKERARRAGFAEGERIGREVGERIGREAGEKIGYENGRKDLIVSMYLSGSITKEAAIETLNITEDIFDKYVKEADE